MCWIRSQDKKSLEEVHNIHYAEVDWGHYIRARFFYQVTMFRKWLFWWQSWTNSNNLVLGKFATKEAALEELNRIHDWIHLQNAVGVYQVSQDS